MLFRTRVGDDSPGPGRKGHCQLVSDGIREKAGYIEIDPLSRPAGFRCGVLLRSPGTSFALSVQRSVCGDPARMKDEGCLIALSPIRKILTTTWQYARIAGKSFIVGGTCRSLTGKTRREPGGSGTEGGHHANPSFSTVRLTLQARRKPSCTSCWRFGLAIASPSLISMPRKLP